MNQPILCEIPAAVQAVMGAYTFPGPVQSVERYGQGHINETYCISCHSGVRFVLQGISKAAFPHPEKLMENFVNLTSYLRKIILEEGGDPDRETLTLVHTRDGKPFYRDETGKVWRLLNFVENTVCYEQATPELFEASGRAFGRFQYMLRDYPAATLHETIEKFHDTVSRFNKLICAVEADKADRREQVLPEIRFVMDRKADCDVVLRAQREGILPLRVTHNDAKLNNVLIDRESGEGICVIDLDTTMPGLAINDFGDSIRFGANHCREDEKDLSKVNFDIALYEIFTRGFLEGAGGVLTPAELQYLPWGARLMTLECGIRFLADYLDGDVYFRVSYPEQNLDRCRTQFKLVRDMELQFEKMQEIVAKYAGSEK